MDKGTAIQKTFEGLKPFQRATVNHCINRFNDGQTKVLVADEVGLGKTLVAKGVIAELYLQHQIESPDKPFKIIYVCSNQAIANQNIKKLNIFSALGDAANGVIEDNRQQDRITLLAYEYDKELEDNFNCTIKAITPGTSFSSRSAGKKEERHLLFRLLRKKIKDKDNQLSIFIKANKRGDYNNWKNEISHVKKIDNFFEADNTIKSDEDYPRINKKIIEIFSDFLLDEIPEDILADINALDYLNLPKGSSILKGLNLILKKPENFYKVKYDKPNFYKPYRKLIIFLRFKLAEACTTLLKADLFILDEFQRFNQVLEYNEGERINGEEIQINDGLALGQKILNNSDNKVLMLSATPFKPYSTDFDENNGEHHSAEFDKIISFLSRNKNGEQSLQLEKINSLKSKFFQYLRNPEFSGSKWDEAVDIRKNLQAEFKNLMCRTERSIAITDANELVEEVKQQLEVNEHDIKDFIIFDGIVKYLNEKGSRLNSPVEYSKSSPFALSFLKEYVHWKKLVSLYNDDEDDGLKKLIRKSGDAWLNPKIIDAYKNVIPTELATDPPNAKLRSLQTEMKSGYDFLWIPASMPYYEPFGTYKISKQDEIDEVPKSYTKMLLFSSWKMVPKMISGIVSYEADRLNLLKMQRLRNDKEIVPYSKNSGKKRYPLSRINAFQTKDDYSGKNDEILSIPSVFLAELYDPQENLADQLTFNDLKKQLKQKIKVLYPQNKWNEFPENTTGGNSKMWSWLSYQLLDFQSEKNNDNWNFNRREDSKIYKDLFNSRKFKGLETKQINKWKDDVSVLDVEAYEGLIDNLVSHCLGNPAICSFRALSKLYPESSKDNLLLAAHIIALGFLSFFDKQESISIIDIATSRNEYNKNIVEYCISGNLQAVLDEYFYMLKDSSGINSPLELAETVQSILQLRAGTTYYETKDSLKSTTISKNKKTHFLRTNFARNFGESDVKSDSSKKINLRDAFNSPFRPFVLATTSIGQEGLDFHYYSHKIMHWNLPHNPIDFEQREGRINRYKSHVIRKNLVTPQITENLEKDKSPWEQVFKIAEEKEKNKTGLIPFWHFPNPKYKIQRLVPLHPFSKDIEKYYGLLRVLKYYRLTFGQPSQNEIIEMLSKQKLSPWERKQLLIDLSPDLEGVLNS